MFLLGMMPVVVSSAAMSLAKQWPVATVVGAVLASVDRLCAHSQ
jgi:hypothetical protein